MRCPACQGETEVIDSRRRKTLPHVNRRRVCKRCGWRFSTWEVLYDPEQVHKYAMRLAAAVRELEAACGGVARSLPSPVRGLPRRVVIRRLANRAKRRETPVARSGGAKVPPGPGKARRAAGNERRGPLASGSDPDPGPV